MIIFPLTNPTKSSTTRKYEDITSRLTASKYLPKTVPKGGEVDIYKQVHVVLTFVIRHGDTTDRGDDVSLIAFVALSGGGRLIHNQQAVHAPTDDEKAVLRPL